MKHLNASWQCDRCGAGARTPSTQQPQGWVGVTFHEPPESSESTGRRIHLCETCAHDHLTPIPDLREAARP